MQVSLRISHLRASAAVADEHMAANARLGNAVRAPGRAGSQYGRGAGTSSRIGTITHRTHCSRALLLLLHQVLLVWIDFLREDALEFLGVNGEYDPFGKFEDARCTVADDRAGREQQRGTPNWNVPWAPHSATLVFQALMRFNEEQVSLVVCASALLNHHSRLSSSSQLPSTVSSTEASNDDTKKNISRSRSDFTFPKPARKIPTEISGSNVIAPQR